MGWLSYLYKFLLGKVGRSDSLPYTKTYAMNEHEAKEELLDSEVFAQWLITEDDACRS